MSRTPPQRHSNEHIFALRAYQIHVFVDVGEPCCSHRRFSAFRRRQQSVCRLVRKKVGRRMLPSCAVHTKCATIPNVGVHIRASRRCRADAGKAPPAPAPAPADQPAPARCTSRRQCLGSCAAQLLAYCCLAAPEAALARVQPPAQFGRGPQPSSPQRAEDPIGLQIADVRRLTEHAEAATDAGDYQQVMATIAYTLHVFLALGFAQSSEHHPLLGAVSKCADRGTVPDAAKRCAAHCICEHETLTEGPLFRARRSMTTAASCAGTPAWR